MAKRNKGALWAALGTTALDWLYPEASSKLGGLLGASGDNADLLGDALIGGVAGGLGGGGLRGAGSGALTASMLSGGGKKIGSALGMDSYTGKLLGDVLLGAGAGELSGDGAGTGAAVAGGLSLLNNGKSEDNPLLGMINKGGTQNAAVPRSGPPSPDEGLDDGLPTRTATQSGGTTSRVGQAGGNIMDFVRNNPAIVAAIVMAATGKGKQPYQAQQPQLPSQFGGGGANPVAQFQPRQVVAPKSYYSYGEAPEVDWMKPKDPAIPAFAEGGALGYLSPDGMGDGRSDHIEAMLSPNEYVFDAETVSLLGNGSPEAGARKLDALRAKVRKQKGAALAKGEISPNAHEDATLYLAEGGRVNAGLKGLKRLKSALGDKADPEFMRRLDKMATLRKITPDEAADSLFDAIKNPAKEEKPIL